MQHPIIVLPGMEYANLCALVTFMYNGEVNIYQEQLPALLAMADTLHIRGLADIAGVSALSSFFFFFIILHDITKYIGIVMFWFEKSGDVLLQISRMIHLFLYLYCISRKYSLY